MQSQPTLQLHTGNEMPVLGLGTWQMDDDPAGTVEDALRMGYRMIDTAVDYGTQPAVGTAIRRSRLSPTEYYLVTKVEPEENAYDGTVRDLEELGLEAVDLIVIHRPPPDEPGVPLWRDLIRARDDQLTMDIGVSNYSIEQIEALIDATGEVPAVNQIEWSPFGWSQDMLDYCDDLGIVVQAYSPLTRELRLEDERLAEIADRYGKTPAQVILRWDLQMGVSPIPKANQRDHLEENLDIFDFELGDTHMDELSELNERWSALGSAPVWLGS